MQWIPLAQIKLNPQAQRDLTPSKVDKLIREMDVKKIGVVSLSHRDGAYFAVDGHHRVTALREAGHEKCSLECNVYEGLTSEQEGALFLSLNDSLPVAAMPKYKVAIHAGDPEACDIDKIAKRNGVLIDTTRMDNVIVCRSIGSIKKVYRRQGADGLDRMFKIVLHSFGESGLKASVMDGVAWFVMRYDSLVTDEQLVGHLMKTAGGAGGLESTAQRLRAKFGGSLPHAIAAAIVEQVNRGRKGKKLPNWWKS